MKKKYKIDKKKATTIGVTLAVILLVCILAVFYNKGNKEEGQNGSVSNIVTKEEKKGKNPLTGLPIEEQYVKSRPYGVMINNIEQAQPLVGVSDADLMYECLVEGGITRILALFQNCRNIDQIGSIRSARPDFINIAQGLDAIYFHMGASVQATEMLKNSSIDSLDLGSYTNMMWRDQQRTNKLGSVHSALTSGQKLVEGTLNEATRTKMKSSYTFKQGFSEVDSQVLDGVGAKKVTAEFSTYKTTTFLYDEEEKEYLIYQFNSPQMDSNQGIQNAKRNILILFVTSYTIDSEGHMGMDLVANEGIGKYISSGKCIDIKWSKNNATDPIKYKTAQGKDLIMTPGRSYICTIPKNAELIIE